MAKNLQFGLEPLGLFYHQEICSGCIIKGSKHSAKAKRAKQSQVALSINCSRVILHMVLKIQLSYSFTPLTY